MTIYSIEKKSINQVWEEIAIIICDSDCLTRFKAKLKNGSRLVQRDTKNIVFEVKNDD